jgi:hypothetical protein
MHSGAVLNRYSRATTENPIASSRLARSQTRAARIFRSARLPFNAYSRNSAKRFISWTSQRPYRTQVLKCSDLHFLPEWWADNKDYVKLVSL